MIAIEQASIFVDGTTGDPRLSHPECVAFDADGAAWCGGDRGELYCVAPDGSAFEQVATSGGFIARRRARRRRLAVLLRPGARAVFRLSLASGALERLSDGDGRMRVPNFAVVDTRRGCLYVSDSHDPVAPGPGVWRIDLESGATDLWYAEPLVFANGMALEPGGDALYVIETWAQRIVRVPIGAAARGRARAGGRGHRAGARRARRRRRRPPLRRLLRAVARVPLRSRLRRATRSCSTTRPRMCSATRRTARSAAPSCSWRTSAAGTSRASTSVSRARRCRAGPDRGTCAGPGGAGDGTACGR